MNISKNIFVLLIFSLSFISFVDVVSAQTILNDTNGKPFVIVLNQNEEKENFDDYVNIIETIFIAIGSISIPLGILFFQRRKQKQGKVWELYTKFHSKEFLPIRSLVWDKVRKKWDEEIFDNKLLKNQIVETFLTREVPKYFLDNKQDKVLKKDNDDENEYDEFISYVTSVQTILDFWTEMYVNLSENTMDEKLASKVFSHIYKWHIKFLIMFHTEYRRQIEESDENVENLNNLWIESFEKLEGLLDIKKIGSEKEAKNFESYKEYVKSKSSS